jgi:hypothetical protein
MNQDYVIIINDFVHPYVCGWVDNYETAQELINETADDIVNREENKSYTYRIDKDSEDETKLIIKQIGWLTTIVTHEVYFQPLTYIEK